MKVIHQKHGKIRCDEADLWLRENDPAYCDRRPVRLPDDPHWLEKLADADPLSERPCVYFIQALNGGPVKIGRCARVSLVMSRLYQLQAANSEELVVRRVVRAHPRLERQLHMYFSGQRLRREWFTPNDELRAVSRAI